MDIKLKKDCIDFNSHAHVERDWLHWIFFPYHDNFNSHAHVERDMFIGIKLFKVLNFNSHAHVERDVGYLISKCCLKNFNSHAHVERDNMNGFNVNMTKISTHTLTWSVTNCSLNSCDCFFISTHTLTWSVTTTFSRVHQSLRFQLTRSRGA